MRKQFFAPAAATLIVLLSLAHVAPADDGKAYADKLEAAGVKVNHEVYKGATHEFFGMGLAVDHAKAAENFAGEQLKKSFAAGSKTKAD